MRKIKLNNMRRLIKFLIGTSLFLTIWANDDGPAGVSKAVNVLDGSFLFDKVISEEVKADHGKLSEESTVNHEKLRQKSSSIKFPSRISLRQLMEKERSSEIRKLLEMDRHGFIDSDIKTLLDLLSTDELADYHLDYEIRKKEDDQTEKGNTDKTLSYYYEYEYDIDKNKDVQPPEDTLIRNSGFVEETSISSTINEPAYLNYYDYEEEFRASGGNPNTEVIDLFKKPKSSLNIDDQVDLSYSASIDKVEEFRSSADRKIEELEETPRIAINEIKTKKGNSSCLLCQALQTPLLTAFNVSLEDAFNGPSEPVKQIINPTEQNNKENRDTAETQLDDEKMDDSVVNTTELQEENRLVWKNFHQRLLSQQDQNNSKEVGSDTKRKLEIISIPTLITSSDFSDNFIDEETTKSSGEAWQAWRGTQLHQHLLIQNERQETPQDQFVNRSNESPGSLEKVNNKVKDTLIDQQDGSNIEYEGSTSRSSGEMWEAWRGQELHRQLLRKIDVEKSTIGPRNLDNLEITVVNKNRIQKQNTFNDQEPKLDCLTSFDKCIILNSNSRRPSLENTEETKNIIPKVQIAEDNHRIEGSGITEWFDNLDEVSMEKKVVIEEQSGGRVFDPHSVEGDMHIKDNIVVIHSGENKIEESTSEEIFIVNPDSLRLEDNKEVNDIMKISATQTITELEDNKEVNDIMKISAIQTITELPQIKISNKQTTQTDTTSEKVAIVSFDDETTTELLPLPKISSKQASHSNTSQSELLNTTKTTLIDSSNGMETMQGSLVIDLELQQGDDSIPSTNLTRNVSKGITDSQTTKKMNNTPTNLLKEITKITGGNFIKIKKEDITENIPEEQLEIATQETFKFKTKSFSFEISDDVVEYDNIENINKPTEISLPLQNEFKTDEQNEILKSSSGSKTDFMHGSRASVNTQQPRKSSQVFASGALSDYLEKTLNTANIGVVQALESSKSNLDQPLNEIFDPKEKMSAETAISENEDRPIIEETIFDKSDVEFTTKFSQQLKREELISFVSSTTQKSPVTESIIQSKELTSSNGMKGLQEIDTTDSVKISASGKTTTIPIAAEITNSANLQTILEDTNKTSEHITKNPTVAHNQIKESLTETLQSLVTQRATNFESTTSDTPIEVKTIISSEEKKLSNVKLIMKNVMENLLETFDTSSQNLIFNATNSDKSQMKRTRIEKEPRSQVNNKGKEPEWLENIQETAVPLLANWIVDYIKKDNSLSTNSNDITQNLVNQAIIENFSQILPSFDVGDISEKETPQIKVITGNLATNLANAIANNSNTILFLYEDGNSTDNSNINNILGQNIDFTHPEIIISEEAIKNSPIEAIINIPSNHSLDNDSNDRTFEVKPIQRPEVTLPPNRLLSTNKPTKIPTIQQNDSLNEINQEASNRNHFQSTRTPFTRPPLRSRAPFTRPTLRSTKVPFTRSTLRSTRIPNQTNDKKLLPTQNFDIATEVTLDPELYEVQETAEKENVLVDSINDNNNNHDQEKHLATRKPQEQNRISNDNNKRNKEILEILNNIRKFNKNNKRNQNISAMKPKNMPDEKITPFGRPHITIPPLRKESNNSINNMNENQKKESNGIDGNDREKTSTEKPTPKVTLPSDILLSTNKSIKRPTIQQNDNDNEINHGSVNQNLVSSTRTPFTRPPLRSTRSPLTRPTLRSTRAPFTRPTLRSTRAPFTRPTLRSTRAPFTRPPLKTRTPFTRPPLRQNPSTQESFTITPIRQNNTKNSIQENRKRNRLNNKINDRKATKLPAIKVCGCKNHGDCLDDDTCFCSHGYAGPKCETSLRKGVVIGGLNGHDLRADIELVGGISRRCAIPDYPLEFMAATAQTFNQTIIVCGGATSQAGKGLAATPSCHSWTLSSPLFIRTFGLSQWSGEFNLTIPRAWAASVRIPHDYMMILGGVDHKNNTLDTIEVVNVGSKTSIPLGLKMPNPLAGHCAVQLNSTHTLVAGGASDGYVGFIGVPSLTAKTWLLSEKGWEEQESLSVARTSHSCSTYITATGDPEVLVTGGVGVSATGTRTILSSVEIFSVATGRWRKGPSLPLPQIGAGLVEMAGRPLLFGGRWQVGGRLQQSESVIHFQVGTNPQPWNPAQFTLKSPRDMGVTVTAPSSC